MALQQLFRNYGGEVVCTNADRGSRGRGLQLVKTGAEGEGIEQGKLQGDKELDKRETAKGEVWLADLEVLSYLDEKLELMMGHCQKEVEGILSTRNLGTLVGEYGSFLRTQVQGDAVLTAPSQEPGDVPRPPNMSEELKLQVSGDGSIAVPDRIAKVFPNTKGIKCNSQTSSNCDNYSGEDLDNAPSSFDESSPDRSPNSMIQMFTTYAIPGGRLLSPLIETFSNLDSGIECHMQTRSNCHDHSGQDPDHAPSSFDDSSPDTSPNSMIQIFTTFAVPGGRLLSPLIETFSKPDSGKRIRRDDFESDHQEEKRRVTFKPELKDWGASRERLRERRELENRPGLAIYNEQTCQQKGGSQLPSPSCSSFKVSCPARLPALGSKGGSSVGSASQEMSEVLQNNQTSHSLSSNRNTASNRREVADYHTHDRINGQIEDHSWKGGREEKASTANYYGEMGFKYRDELYRKRRQC